MPVRKYMRKILDGGGKQKLFLVGAMAVVVVGLIIASGWSASAKVQPAHSVKTSSHHSKSDLGLSDKTNNAKHSVLAAGSNDSNPGALNATPAGTPAPSLSEAAPSPSTLVNKPVPAPVIPTPPVVSNPAPMPICSPCGATVPKGYACPLGVNPSICYSCSFPIESQDACHMDAEPKVGA